ncbi:MAG: OmpA family protein [Betaproteobacteria bacterium]|jgi:peptidoglycan-associated lipoprotein
MIVRTVLALAVFCAVLGCSNKTKSVADIEQRELFDNSDRGSFEQSSESSDEALQRQQEELKAELEREERRLLEEQQRTSSLDSSVEAGDNVIDPKSKLNEPDSLLAQRSIYYMFDSFEIQAEYKPILEAHSKFLVDNPSFRVRIEGNCDDRGSREYNLALGQSRAEQIRKSMLLLGVSVDQIEVVSFGAERPVAYGFDEASRAKNRRSDLVYID